jgi:rod shape-determining protein MreB and related proteins
MRLLPSIGGRDIAVDLGTANTLVYAAGAGIVVSEPSVVALDERTGQVHAVGEEAKRMIGRTPGSISAVRPLRHGVIADFEVTERMLSHFMGKVQQSRLARPRVVMCAPSGITGVELRALEEACLAAGARGVEMIEEPMAAALGAGLEIDRPSGHMVVDVGGGTTEVAVLSLGGIVLSKSVRVGGYDLDEAIIAHIRARYGFVIGQPTAEELKLEVGSAFELEQELSAEVRGRDRLSGLPKTVDLSSEEVRVAIREPLARIVAAVRAALEVTPPELAADIAQRGILLAGGGVLLRGFAERLDAETKMRAVLAPSPLTCVATGAGLALERPELRLPNARDGARGAGAPAAV